MHQPTAPVLQLIHDLFEGNRHTLIARAREEERREKILASRRPTEPYHYHPVRSTYIDFSHLKIAVTVNTATGQILTAWAEGMVVQEGIWEEVRWNLLEEPPDPDPAQLRLELGQRAA
ncbi:MAG: hypothetical protein ABI599_13855 [Flavobacteriales bacterium]